MFRTKKLLRYLRRHGKKKDTPYLMGGMVGILAFLILGVFSLSVINHYVLGSSSLASVISAALVDLTNGDRRGNDLGGLAQSPVLTAAAQAKADDMAAKGYFAHVSPDGKDSWYWFKQANYPFLYAGENLAVDFSDSVDVEHAWMNSPAHRANILNGHFTEIGIATAPGFFQGHPTTFVVQMFGTPSTSGELLAVRTISLPTESTSPSFATTESAEPVAKGVAGGSVTAPIITPAAKSVLGAEMGINAPATARPIGDVVSSEASWWQHLLASPKAMLRYSYYVFAGVILILLAFVTEFEFHRRHLRHVAAAAFLFVLMIGLFALADLVFFATPILAAPQALIAG